MANYKINDALDIYEAENTYFLKAPHHRIGKFLAHYELYKRILTLPGDVLELGVYKGASLMRFLAFRETLENQHSRKVLGFDAFGKFPVAEGENQADQQFIEKFEGAGGQGISREDLDAAIQAKATGNVELIPGDVFETLPAYLERRPELRIAILHLDMDVYKPTQFALSLLAERVVPGGLIVFDDYNAVGGATIAADEFAQRTGLALEKLPHYSVPAFFTIPRQGLQTRPEQASA
jgi:hypothetical protein